jgi:hypothetical protein
MACEDVIDTIRTIDDIFIRLAENQRCANRC